MFYHKKRRIIISIIFLLLVSPWLFSLATCEYATIKYGDEFKGLEAQTNMLTQSDYLKVLDVSETYAKVYYVSPYSGNVLYFEKSSEAWRMVEWETVWSSTGSASGVVWPYWYHFIYGGF